MLKLAQNTKQLPQKVVQEIRNPDAFAGSMGLLINWIGKMAAAEKVRQERDTILHPLISGPMLHQLSYLTRPSSHIRPCINHRYQPPLQSTPLKTLRLCLHLYCYMSPNLTGTFHHVHLLPPALLVCLCE